MKARMFLAGAMSMITVFFIAMVVHAVSMPRVYVNKEYMLLLVCLTLLAAVITAVLAAWDTLKAGLRAKKEGA